MKERYNKQLFIPSEIELQDPPTKLEVYIENKLKKQKEIKYRSQSKNKQSLEAEYYLRTYKENLKQKESINNSLTIERLGFDENESFKGEEYHG